jgi:RNA polymerase sigma factor (sigma-70 family)
MIFTASGDRTSNMTASYPDLTASSPSPSVGVCSDPCREAATIGSGPTDGGGGTEVVPGHHAHKVINDDETWSRVMGIENRAQVHQCIDLLDEPCRTVLLLRDIEELDTEETALMLNVTRGDVKTRLHRARQCLRVLLQERHPQ